MQNQPGSLSKTPPSGWPWGPTGSEWGAGVKRPPTPGSSQSQGNPGPARPRLPSGSTLGPGLGARLRPGWGGARLPTGSGSWAGRARLGSPSRKTRFSRSRRRPAETDLSPLLGPSGSPPSAPHSHAAPRGLGKRPPAAAAARGPAHRPRLPAAPGRCPGPRALTGGASLREEGRATTREGAPGRRGVCCQEPPLRAAAYPRRRHEPGAEALLAHGQGRQPPPAPPVLRGPGATRLGAAG